MGLFANGKKTGDFLSKAWDFIGSNQGARMFGNMSNGVSFPAAYSDSIDWKMQNDYMLEDRDMRKQMFQNRMEDRGLNNQLTRGRIDQMNAPAPQFNDVYNDDGQITGQRNSTNNKFNPFPQRGNQGPLRAADNRYHNEDGSLTFPGVVPAPHQMTLSQDKQNQEIQDARNKIKNIQVPEGSTLRAEVQRRTQSNMQTGRINADYDPMLVRAMNRATNRMTGQDAGYQDFMSGFTGGGPNTQPTNPGLLAAGNANAGSRGSVIDRGIKRLNQMGVNTSDREKAIREANEAIQQGAPEDKIMQRLKEMGIEY